MKNYSFEKNIDLLLALFLILALFLGKSILVGYLSCIFLVFSVIIAIQINVNEYFFNQNDTLEEDSIDIELFNMEEKSLQEEALKSFKTLVCRL